MILYCKNKFRFVPIYQALEEIIYKIIVSKIHIFSLSSFLFLPVKSHIYLCRLISQWDCNMNSYCDASPCPFFSHYFKFRSETNVFSHCIRISIVYRVFRYAKRTPALKEGLWLACVSILPRVEGQCYLSSFDLKAYLLDAQWFQ